MLHFLLPSSELESDFEAFLLLVLALLRSVEAEEGFPSSLHSMNVVFSHRPISSHCVVRHTKCRQSIWHTT